MVQMPTFITHTDTHTILKFYKENKLKAFFKKEEKKELKTIYIPGFKAKLSIKLFQAMKAIFLIMGIPLRKPSSSSCNKELIKLPLRCKV